ncbi:hypothetical protein cce_3238 [Crocosphaera subtropica ATCC 51142]|uniref:Uncharacterized protein n=1 Tax=Crocosphaera subtropica (strain ATCC 51142 / BH68) TaxID=43989 RepID=B1WXP5_CROS5|nr:hypothetical protein [Crocosphaera subtropica]ACB52586.1 hypothetical protein cce_3238 [Crocosphaera subtropica ATCC 51142]
MNQSLLNSFQGCLFSPKIANFISHQKPILVNWEIINQKIIRDLIQTETISRETCQGITLNESPISSGKFVLNSLPLILFFYETETLLYEQLEKIKNHNDITQKTIQDVMVFRQIICLILNQPQQPLINHLTISPELTQLQAFLNHQTPLTEIKKQFREKTVLDSNYLLLSLYCFCRTPDNYKLSILQASQFNHPVILGITAVLSGAYNGYFGIPVSWRLNITTTNKDDSHYQQISQLWAKWVGVDQPLKILGSIQTQVVNSLEANNRYTLQKQ